MEEYKCDICSRDFSTQDSLNQHNLAKHSREDIGEKAKINFKKYFIFTAIGLIIILSVLSVKSYMGKPGEYDDFAKCLTEKDAVIYGNDYCSYTVKQLNFFGKSQKHLNYIKCSENNELCNSKGVQTTPTWEINKETYSGVQTFDALSAYSGCEI